MLPIHSLNRRRSNCGRQTEVLDLQDRLSRGDVIGREHTP